MTEPRLADDEFYTAPEITGHQPGALLKMRKAVLPQLDSVQAWQILYVATDNFGEKLPASGSVIVPDSNAAAGAGPLVAYVPSFHGMGGRCAPSQLLQGGAEREIDHIAMALDRGWTVAIPDGRGLGVHDVGPHTFLAGFSGGAAVLDIVRAAQTIPDLDCLDAPIGVWGYADGGRYAVWAAEMAPDYAPELDLRGVTAGAVIADPGELAERYDLGPYPGLGWAATLGLARANSHLPMLHMVNPIGQTVLSFVQNSTATQVLARFGRPISQYCDRADPWSDPVWRYALDRERSGQRNPRCPLHLYHGTDDIFVPIETAEHLRDTYRAAGVEVSWRDYQCGHYETATEGASEAVTRLSAYLQHQPDRPDKAGPTTFPSEAAP
ncbi:lipase family protein [Nocardia sp. XZ_19_385]|uniref:lipase family protein n=1 Tax=Nocardia sp. XZ_19_385 TaxID=2769488 RepID=UPI00188F45D0|nr:lipase family protein [Nocardia sp. XZ_19_385]